MIDTLSPSGNDYVISRRRHAISNAAVIIYEGITA